MDRGQAWGRRHPVCPQQMYIASGVVPALRWGTWYLPSPCVTIRAREPWIVKLVSGRD